MSRKYITLEGRARSTERKFIEAREFTPQSAYNVIERTLNDIQSGEDFTPVEAIRVRELIVKSLYATRTPSNLNSLSNSFNDSADFECVRGTASYDAVKGLAIIIGLLTGQRSTSKYAPEAIRGL